MDRDQVISVLRTREGELRRAGIVSVSLFGSVARDSAGDVSDVDLAIRFAPERRPRGFAYFGFLEDLEEELANALGRAVDVIEEPTVRPRLQDMIDHDRVRAF